MPEIEKFDLEAIKKRRERDRKSDLEFMDFYVEWLKKTPNEVWSKQHADFINSGILIANECKNLKVTLDKDGSTILVQKN